MSSSSSFLIKRQLIKRLVFENKYDSAYHILLDLLTVYPNDYEILSQIGYVSYLMESYNEAISYYKRCININNEQIDNSFVNNWFSYWQYAKLLHVHSGDFENAKIYYIKSLKLNDENIEIYYDIAKLYNDIENYSQSQTYFEQFFDLIDEYKEINYLCKRIKQIQDTMIDIAHFEYGKLLFYKLDHRNNGKHHVQIAIDIKPTNIDYQFEFAIMLKICASFKKAKKYFIQCIELSNEQNPHYLYQYGLFLTDSLKDTISGMLYVKKALDLQPNNDQYKNEYFALKNWNQYQAKLKQEKGEENNHQKTGTKQQCQSSQPFMNNNNNHNNHNKSGKCYANIINTKKGTNSTQKLHFNHHRQHIHRREYNNNNHHHLNNNNNREIYNSIKRDARRIKFDDGSHGNNVIYDNNGQTSIDWDKICGTNNKYSSRILEFKSKFKIACQAQAEHNYILAKNILEDLIKIAPEDGEIFGRYAFALAQLNNLYEAEKYYKKSLILSPRNYVTMYNYAFLLYYKLQRYEEAETLYKKCLKIKPNCAKALLNYARLLDTIKKKKLSEQYYRMCLSGSPNYDLCFYYFGCFLYRQERYEEAKYFLQKAVNCWPHSHLHHFRLAVTCHILCEYDKCEHHLKEALRIKPNFEAAMEAYERYGYGKIQRNKQNGKLVFHDYPYNKSRNRHNHHPKVNNNNNKMNNNNTSNNNADENGYNHYNYKNTNRNGKYYVKKQSHHQHGGFNQNIEGVVHPNITSSGNDRLGHHQENNGGDYSDTPNTATTVTDFDKEHSPDTTTDSSSHSNGTNTNINMNKQHLRMYDPIRRNHRFNIDEKWIDDSGAIKHYSDDKKYFINWLKSIRLYDQVRFIFDQNGIDTMKQFHSQIPSKQSLISLFEKNRIHDSLKADHDINAEQIIDIIWDSAPKQFNTKKKPSTYWSS